MNDRDLDNFEEQNRRISELERNSIRLHGYITALQIRVVNLEAGKSEK